MLINTIHFFISLLSIAAMMILNYSIFKIPILKNHRQLTILTLSVGTINFYLKEVVQSNFFFFAQLVLTMILLTLLRKYPLFYSFIVTVTGAIVFSFVDGVVSYGAIRLHITTYEEVMNNLLVNSILHIIVTLIYVLISYFLIKNKIGFSFVVRRFSGKYALKTSTFIWATLLSIGILILQIGAKQFSLSSLHLAIMISLTIILLASLYYAYIQNKKVLKDRAG